ncbi:MAG: S8 family serine peptidase, partial [Paracoccaceae bacterium]
MPVMRFFVLLIACLFGTAASAETHPWRLADADQISSTGYLILTVPMADDETLSAVATGIEKRYDVNLAAEWPLRAITVHCLVVDIRGHSDIEALIKRMRSDKTIRTVQKMQEFEVFESSSFEGLYSDPLLPSQLAMRQLNAVKAHLQSTGEGIRIGVVDSRIDEAHPDLSNRLFDARDFVSKEIDTIGEPHGTAIAGIIGADGANAAGIVGVAPGAERVGLRGCGQEGDMRGRCSRFSIARSLNFAILN